VHNRTVLGLRPQVSFPENHGSHEGSIHPSIQHAGEDAPLRHLEFHRGALKHVKDVHRSENIVWLTLKALHTGFDGKKKDIREAPGKDHA
jgi:hypothetical protein